MSTIEANIFPLLNLEDLSSRYNLYKIKGLNQGNQTKNDEIYRRVNSLVTDLSYSLQIPVTSIQEDETHFLVVRDDAENVPAFFDDVRNGRLLLEKHSETYDLNYAERSTNNDKICIKFLQFMLREPLGNDRRLWSPGAGRPFYELNPYPIDNRILQYTGFKPRIVTTHDGGLGVCVDVTHRHTSIRPLPTHLKREDFSRWENRYFIYRYGYKWYQIKAGFLSELNVSETMIKVEDELISLLDYIGSKTDKPLPAELLNLPPNAAVIGYRNNRKEVREAPAALCYQVFGPHDAIMKKYHQEAILSPDQRRPLIHKYVQKHLKNLRFGNTNLKISEHPLTIPARKFVVPDLEFANNHILSVRGTKNSHHVSLDNLGETRLSMLKDGPGFYDSKPLSNHYLILPYTIFHSYGEKFAGHLKDTVDKLFPQERGYNPKIVIYDDRGDKIWAIQAAAIKAAVQKNCQKEGFAVVMIHPVKKKNQRDEDILAAAVMKELHSLKIFSTIIHTKFTGNCYKFGRGKDGKPYCSVRHTQKTRLAGYLQGVAINKILLNEFRTPFRLATKLHADLSIGIDVKSHTAGFVIVGKRGANVRFDFDFEQTEKEKISFGRMKKCFKKILLEEMEFSTDDMKNIVVQRDGKLHTTEIEAMEEALKEVTQFNGFPKNAKLTFLEIHKNSEAPFRLFEVNKHEFGRATVLNPQVGYYYLADNQNGYLCSTGRAFRRRGTVNPLHVKFIKGNLEFEKCLEDIYYLTTLTWTNPRDCSREPITIKLTDRYLGEEAGEYNKNDLITAVQALKAGV